MGNWGGLILRHYDTITLLNIGLKLSKAMIENAKIVFNILKHDIETLPNKTN